MLAGVDALLAKANEVNTAAKKEIVGLEVEHGIKVTAADLDTTPAKQQRLEIISSLPSPTGARAVLENVIARSTETVVEAVSSDSNTIRIRNLPRNRLR